jgi:thioredoxin 1
MPVKEISTQSFESEVIESGQPVLVDFYAPWCSPCRALTPVLEELAAEFAGRIKIVKINVDKNRDFAGRFEITKIPTLMLFADSHSKDTVLGLKTVPVLRRKLDTWLASSLEAEPAK